MRFRPPPQKTVNALTSRHAKTTRAPLSLAMRPVAVTSVALLVGVLLAGDPLVTAAVGGTLLAIIIMVMIPRSAPLMVFAAPLAVGQVSGFGGIAALLCCVVVFGIRTRSLLHPLVLYGAPISLYLLIGGANLSTYRGEVSSATLRLTLIYVLVLLLGAAISGGVAPRTGARDRSFTVRPGLLMAGFLPGVIGMTLIIQRAGLPLLHPNSREDLGGLRLLLGETLLAGLALYCCHVFTQRKPRRADWLIFALALLGLANSGYRGWPIVGAILIAASGVYFGRLHVTLWRVAALSTLCVLIIAGGDFIRRDTTAGNTIGALTTQEVATRYGAQAIPPGIREVHFTFREAIAITQTLVQDRRIGHRIRGSLLLADFETMLPGKQLGGGQLIGQVVGIRGDTGLTGGAVGVSFMDIGYLSLLLFFGVGLFIGQAWRMASKAANWAIFYFLFSIYALHWFHRGVPKPSYLIVPLLFLLMSSLAPQSRASTAGGPSRRTIPKPCFGRSA
jgi:hypothetical protein